MRKILALISITAFILIYTIPVMANDNSLVVTAQIDDEIRAGTVQYLTRALKVAQEREADLFILKINTPGGLVKATEDITRLLLDTEIRTAVFVHKSGGWAYSAGTYILLSAEIAAAHPTSSIGAAQPRALGQEGEPDPKIVEASARWLVSLAEIRDRNVFVAEEFVRENLTLSGQEAADLHVINMTAESLPQLLDQLELSQAQIEKIRPNFIENILSFLSIPYLVPLLLSLGAVGLFLVFRTGEIESIGIFALIFLILGLWGMGAINLSALGASLLILGVILIVLELFVTADFGILGIAGGISLLIGMLTFANEPFLPHPFTQALFWVVMGIGAAAALFFVVLGRYSVKTLKQAVVSGPESFIGKEAQVLTDLDPSGRIKINGENWTAKTQSHGRIKAGQRVVVVKIEGNTIIVKEPNKDNE